MDLTDCTVNVYKSKIVYNDVCNNTCKVMPYKIMDQSSFPAIEETFYCKVPTKVRISSKYKLEFSTKWKCIVM